MVEKKIIEQKIGEAIGLEKAASEGSGRTKVKRINKTRA